MSICTNVPHKPVLYLFPLYRLFTAAMKLPTPLNFLTMPPSIWAPDIPQDSNLISFLRVLAHWRPSMRCSWRRWRCRRSFWSAPRWERGEVACTPPSPTGRNRHARGCRKCKGAWSARATRTRSYWSPELSGSPSSFHWAPWMRWSSCSRWSEGSVAWCPLRPGWMKGCWILVKMTRSPCFHHLAVPGYLSPSCLRCSTWVFGENDKR